MVSKTRDKLMDVARQLFAKKGIENTTMADIATASERGRRTVYSYFASKQEIYNSILERESDQLVSRIRQVADTALTPTDKVKAFIIERINMLKPMTRHR